MDNWQCGLLAEDLFPSGQPSDPCPAHIPCVFAAAALRLPKPSALPLLLACATLLPLLRLTGSMGAPFRSSRQVAIFSPATMTTAW